MPSPLTIATWNINSVRLRLDQVLRFLLEQHPDVLCLQETKCPDDLFPRGAFAKAGYGYQAIAGIKGYNGVAILSRRPITPCEKRDMCGKPDARHIAATIGQGADAIRIHNFYVPAGGDLPDPEANPKFAHKLAFVEELQRFSETTRRNDPRAILVGDLNIAPLEHDVWSHKQLLDVVSHTPVETRGLTEAISAGEWVDAMRVLKPEPEKVYSWWSYRSPDWDKADKGRRLDHVWLGRALGDTLHSGQILRETRGWERPSDHVPVMVTLDLG
ncbi:MAG: exodeoxyribonuclease III [Hyphomicrobiales bacterium]|uniref:exodeoxyribonuclease III n=1 Tax=Rhabdaerophilum calidifontis TaxID=2604328 RepID=UPI00123C0C96|nr:exodeoxyribonuclease III [Rhabdaerophilum calidifontis]MCA1953305.1 exodeoxyribonuclease III [Hyphomicrobiales bacterium]MCA1999364.1 exodeoxyribonuclease III [Hyphomicrobiales bacterium]